GVEQFRLYVVSGFSRTVTGPPEGGRYVRMKICNAAGSHRRSSSKPRKHESTKNLQVWFRVFVADRSRRRCLSPGTCVISRCCPGDHVDQPDAQDADG